MPMLLQGDKRLLDFQAPISQLLAKFGTNLTIFARVHCALCWIYQKTSHKPFQGEGASLEFQFSWNVEHLKHENGLKLVKNGQKFTIWSILVDCQDTIGKDYA